jgi:hypothetical protein
LPRIAIAIACNGLRDCVAIAVALPLPLPLPLSLPSRNTAFNAYFGQQQAAQPSQSSTIGFSNMTFSLLSFSRPREAQASRFYDIAVVDCLPLPCNGNGNAHTHCTPIAGPLPFVAIALSAFLHCHCRCIAIACGRFCLSRNPMAIGVLTQHAACPAVPLLCASALSASIVQGFILFA